MILTNVRKCVGPNSLIQNTLCSIWRQSYGCDPVVSPVVIVTKNKIPWLNGCTQTNFQPMVKKL